MWLFGHLFNMSYVIWSSGHLVIVSSGHLVILSSGLLVIWSFPILWNPVLFLWNTWIIIAHSESCFGDIIEQSGYLVILPQSLLNSVCVIDSFGAWSQLLNKCIFVLYVSFSCGGIRVGLSAILHSYDLLCLFTTLCHLFQRGFFAFFNIEFAKGALAKLQLLACNLKPSACFISSFLNRPVYNDKQYMIMIIDHSTRTLPGLGLRLDWTSLVWY